MPRFRRPFRKRRPFRGRRRGGPKYTTWGSAKFLARKAVRGLRYVRGLVNSEMFKFDGSATNTALLPSGGITSLIGITQGDGDSGRTGNSILVKSINIRGNLIMDPLAGTMASVRLTILEDTQQIADTLPTFGDIYENASTYSHLQSNTVGRFKILKTRTYRLCQTMPLVPFQLNLPLQHHVRFNGSTSTDVQRGALYFVYSSDQASPANPIMNWEFRTSYHDN